MKPNTLWTFDFTVITIGTVISAIGSIAMSFALSLVVFDETSSTMLTGLFTAVSFIPSAIIPLLAAPYVDRHIRKHIIVRLDVCSGIFYVLFTLYLVNNDFSYMVYMCFSFLVNSIGAVYNLAYTSLYPDLIPKGFAQKGYSISSVIYPSITAIVTPIASVLYVRYGIAIICFTEGILLLIASYFEHLIRYQEQRNLAKEAFSLQKYKADLMEGLNYMKEEKGIRSIYAYMAITNGAGNGNALMIQTFFQSSTIYTTTMYALLSTAEMIGRILGSVFHYFVKIPYKKRYSIALNVYVGFEALDMMLLFLAYPLMVINRFVAGFLGINSLNIREASTQNYIPATMRARVNAFFSMVVAFMMVCAKLVAGFLGEFMPYSYIVLLFAFFSSLCILFFIVKNKKHVAPIFNQDI